MINDEYNPYIYIGYSIDEWAEKMQVMYNHEDTAAIAEEMLDDMAVNTQDDKQPPDVQRIGNNNGWCVAWIESQLKRP